MNQKTVLGFVMLLMIFQIGCKDDNLKDDTNVSIENEFRINIWENLSEDTRTFQINIETIKSESCENDLIDVASTFFGNDIVLDIHDYPTADCTYAAFPATASFEVGSLPSNDFDLEINLKEVVQNRGILTVSDNSYQIQMDAQDGISIPVKKLFRVPQNTIWGFVKYNLSTENDIAEDFISDIKGMASLREFIDGNYGYFSVSDNQLSIANIGGGNSHLRKEFGFEYQGDDAELLDVLNDFRSTHPALEFKIFTSKGKEL